MDREKENDMSGAEAASAGERSSARNARRAAMGEDQAPSASAIGEAVARALDRVAKAPPPERALAPVVRASVRVGYEDYRQEMGDGSIRIVTRPKKFAFSADDTIDGKAYTLEDGKPIRLKREAFERLRDQGVVLRAD